MIDEVESDNSINGRDETDRNIDQLVQLFEQYDRSALADILLANDGNMEETISLLLSQSTAQNNNSQVDCTSKNQPTDRSVDEDEDQRMTSKLTSLDDELLVKHMQEEYGILSPSQSPPIQSSPESRRGGPPVSSPDGETTLLQDDFLRPPGWVSTEVKDIKNQVEEDERLAMLLQNEDYLEESPEFLSQDTRNPSETSIVDDIKAIGEGKWTKRSPKEGNIDESEEPSGNGHRQ